MLVRGQSRYHVQWKDTPENGWTWEPESNLQDEHSRGLLQAFKAEQAKLESVSPVTRIKLSDHALAEPP